MNPSVSVIMPAYNAGAYIAASIKSVLDQTYPASEIIVVDDGSSDDTCNVAGSFGDKIRLLTQANAGPGEARNTAANLATGDWLAFLDADDLWHHDKLERQIHAADPDDGIIYSDRINFGEIGALSERQSDGVKLHEGDIFERLLMQGNFITMSSACIRRELLSSLGGFNPAASVAGVEDWELWLRASRRCQVRLVREALVRYRCHADGISKNVPAMFQAHQQVLDAVLDGADPRVQRQARCASARITAWFAMNQSRFGLGLKLYGRAIRYCPNDLNLWKGALKCLLRRR